LKDKLIVALDKPCLNAAQDLITEIGDEVEFYKVGLELFLNTKGQIIDFLKGNNKKIFLDLKFHDIPNTVAQSAKWATTLGVDIFDIHAVGGEEMLAKTVEVVKETAIKEGVQTPKVVAITVLTSFNEAGFNKLGFSSGIRETVINWSQMCKKAGLDGVVSSTHEVQDIKKACGKEFLTICPGVRPIWAATQDQKRIMTPAKAINVGVDYIVVGRTITASSDPQEAAKKIIQEMEGVKSA